MYNACITISSLVPDLQVSGSSVGEGDTHSTHKIENIHTHTGEGYTQPSKLLLLGFNALGWELFDTLLLLLFVTLYILYILYIIVVTPASCYQETDMEWNYTPDHMNDVIQLIPYCRMSVELGDNYVVSHYHKAEWLTQPHTVQGVHQPQFNLGARPKSSQACQLDCHGNRTIRWAFHVVVPLILNNQ